MTLLRPDASEFHHFYAGYVAVVPDGDIRTILAQQRSECVARWRQIPESEAATIHAPYQWKVRQVLDHLTDGERIFGYRLFRIARGDQTPLPGYDESFYAAASERHPAPLADIIESFECLRQANLNLVRNLSDSVWNCTGTANNSHITVRALTYILAGHVFHHDVILRKRLGLVVPD